MISFYTSAQNGPQFFGQLLPNINLWHYIRPEQPKSCLGLNYERLERNDIMVGIVGHRVSVLIQMMADLFQKVVEV